MDEPDGTLAVVLTLFPLTSPVAMLMRLVARRVPAWQVLLALALLLLKAAFIVRGVAATFRAQVLLAGQSFTLRRYIGLILGGARS